MSNDKMPTLAEVLDYAQPQLRKIIGKKAKDLPEEQKREIEQEGFIRLIANYETIDPTKGWKSFVYTHCHGAVLDYLKAGEGFEESRTSIRKTEPKGSKNPDKIRDRVQLIDFDGHDADIDVVLGNNGRYSKVYSSDVTINWDLVSRMSSIDECLRAFAMHLRGHTIEQIAPTFGHCRARAGQLIQAFVARFDDPNQSNEIWFKQTCFAFGLCKVLNMPDVDQSVVLGYSVGWKLEPVDLDDVAVVEEEQQLDLFGEASGE